MAAPKLIKKYGNRRLYDTDKSRHVTLDELAAKIRGGDDVKVIDAKSGEDITQATLTQIIVEGRDLARLLPVPLLTQLIRLGDDALAEFFGRYVTGALEVYLHARHSAQAISAFNPLAALPLAASEAIARMWMSQAEGEAPATKPGPEPAPASADDVAALRAEIAELRRAMRKDPDGGDPE